MSENEWSANEVTWLLGVHEAVFDAVEKAETRLVVEVWGKDDQGPVAWIEAHPSDSEAVIWFSRERPDSAAAKPATDTETDPA